jgi:hypothetical protein
MPPREDTQSELFRTLTLLHPDPILMKTLESWCAGAPDAEVAEGLRNWNEAKYLELQEWMPTLGGQDLEAVQRKLAAYEETRRPLEAREKKAA